MIDYDSLMMDAAIEAHMINLGEDAHARVVEDLENECCAMKQDKIDSAANARAAKKLTAKERAVEVKKFNAKMQGKAKPNELVRLVKEKFGISKATFHRDLNK